MSAKILYDMTWEEFAAEIGRGCVAIVPVGSTEQHGLHLPLGCDTMVAISLAEAASERTGAVVAPPMWFGWSPHHMVLPGTITVRPEILTELLYDVLESLGKHGLNKVVLINGHRLVNIPWMQIACQRAQSRLGMEIVIFDPAYMSKEIVDALDFGPLGHAEEIESSHMWYCRPELYREEKVKDFVPEKRQLYSVDPRYPGDTLCYLPSTLEAMEEAVKAAGGVTGSPTKSSREKGKKYHEHLVSRLVDIIGRLKSS